MGEENRRPIRARSVMLFRQLAATLAKTNVTPNQISVASVFFALLVPIAYFYIPATSWLAALVALLGIQLRLFCNLLDGMVAIEGAKKSKLGDIYNEFPDRIADTVIILGLALPAFSNPLVIALAWGACFFAILTAYTRVLGAAVGAKHYFTGPMAKQQRMALLSLTVIAIPALQGWFESQQIILIVLTVICLGSLITTLRRLLLISKELNQK
jgi:phosphatidylglycerophosphate synthase